MNNIEYVKKGYEDAALLYRKDKDMNQSNIAVFNEWLLKVENILELGCASGFPIAKKIIESGKKYIGIDLSSTQIALARKEFPQWEDKFHEAEMLEYIKNTPDNSFDGIVSMFSIRHLARIHHVELFSEIRRVLQSDGYLLIDHTDKSFDKRGTWFGDLPMYWSGFSKEWQQLTLKELGFQLINCEVYSKNFQGKEEITTFCIYQCKK